MPQIEICGESYDDYLIRMEEFHGYRSPGMLLGGFMIDHALSKLGKTPYLNVVVETVVCLPDSVQLLTPCTFGNGFMQVLDWGKFALTLYDRISLRGIRARLNHEKLTAYPEIRTWFERTGRKREKPPFDRLAQEMINARFELIHIQPMRMLSSLKDPQPVPTRLCPSCRESYPLRFGEICPACSGQAYCRPESE